MCCTAAALVHYVSFQRNTVQWQLQGVSSQNVFFETPARLSNYDIFNNWELAAWSQGFTICVLTSVTQKNVPSTEVIHYCTWYVFLRDRRYSLVFHFIIHSWILNVHKCRILRTFINQIVLQKVVGKNFGYNGAIMVLEYLKYALRFCQLSIGLGHLLLTYTEGSALTSKFINSVLIWFLAYVRISGCFCVSWVFMIVSIMRILTKIRVVHGPSVGLSVTISDGP